MAKGLKLLLSQKRIIEYTCRKTRLYKMKTAKEHCPFAVDIITGDVFAILLLIRTPGGGT